MKNQNTSLESTNTRLTGNIKLVFDTNQNLFLESINSTASLSSVMFKGFQYNEVVGYGENIKSFIDMNFISSEELFGVKNDKSDLIDTNFSNQLSTIYKYGCYSEASQLINENLRYFAPFYLNDFESSPDYFVIIRNESNKIFESEYMTSKNVVDLAKSGKIIQIFDLSKLKKIFKNIQKSSMYVNFDDDKNEDSVILTGLDFQTGLYGQRMYTGFSDVLNNETTISEFNNTMSNLFMKTNLIFSNILNLEFAFTDDETNGFANYSGFYLTSKELETIQDLKNHTFPTKFILANELRTYENETELKTYKKLLGTSTSISTGLQEYQIGIIKFKLNPEPQTSLKIYVNNVLDYELMITKSMIAEKLKDTLDLISKEINTNYKGEQSTIAASFTKNNELILESKHLSDDILHLTIDTTSVVFENNNKKIRFKGSSTRTFISRNLYPETKQIKFKNDYYNIVDIYKFDNTYYYESDRVIKIGTSLDLKIEHYSVLNEKPIIGEFIPHVKLDTNIDNCNIDNANIDNGNIEDHQNFDVLDFDATNYRLYLLNKVSEDSYIGAAEEYFEHGNLTPAEIAEYKNIITTKINQYFNSFSYSTNYLIKNLNLNDKTASPEILVNPYERLEENDLPSLRSVNRLHQFIQKWRLSDAVDSYFNPYLLNISLAMRSDNFSASSINELRDLKEHTLHWFIIGSGQPPYFSKENSSINDKLGYTKTIVTKESILDETSDFYENELTYFDDKKFASSWSKLKYDSYQETCFTIFKGVKYKFDDKNLDGYRFSIIMKTNEIRETSNGFDIEFLKNDTYRTFTLLVYFYIPEPILTSLEGGIPYFVDRSLFYFSNEIYASKKSQINFGESTISLDLYNTTQLKKYNITESTRDYIVYNPDLGMNMMYIGRGNQGRFRTSFKEILELGGSLTCSYTQSDDIDSPYYGITMIFSDIVDIHDNGFWCTSVQLITVKTEDTDGIDDEFIDDNIVTDQLTIDVLGSLEQNRNLVNSNNIYYYSRHIARELFVYNKIVSSSANNLRYRSITLANIATILDLKLLENPYNFSIVKSDGFYAPISLYAEKLESSSELKKLDKPYFYPMYRYEGEYVPMLKTIYDFKEIAENEIETINISNVVDYKKFSTILQTNYVKNKIVAPYSKSILSTVFDTYSYLQSTQDNVENFLTLPWLAFPYELRNLSSVCFNSDEIIVDYTTTNEISFEDICKFKQSTWLNLQSIFSNSSNVQSLKNFYKHSTGSEISDSEIERKILIEFMKKTFLSIYMIDNVLDLDNNKYEYMIENEKIVIQGEPDKAYLIRYKR